MINYNGRFEHFEDSLFEDSNEEHFVVDPFFFLFFLRADNSMIIDEIIEKKIDRKIVQIFPIFIPIDDRNYSYLFVELATVETVTNIRK